MQPVPGFRIRPIGAAMLVAIAAFTALAPSAHAAGQVVPAPGTSTCTPTGQGFLNTPPTPDTIPDDTGDAIEQVMNITEGGSATVWDVDVLVGITHSYDADLQVWLTAPDGTEVDLSTYRGAGDYFDGGISFDDQAAAGISDFSFAGGGVNPLDALRPESPLSVLRGKPVNGTWSLTVQDDEAADTGTLDGWGMMVTICTPPPVPPPAPPTPQVATPIPPTITFTSAPTTCGSSAATACKGAASRKFGFTAAVGGDYASGAVIEVTYRKVNGLERGKTLTKQFPASTSIPIQTGANSLTPGLWRVTASLPGIQTTGPRFVLVTGKPTPVTAPRRITL
jgi:subtilisin-like proprotein convertase family protein